MRLRKRRGNGDIASSIEAACRATEEAAGRLGAARDLIATQRERARAERVTITAALRKMRAQNNLAGMILSTVEQEARDDAGEAGGGPD